MLIAQNIFSHKKYLYLRSTGLLQNMKFIIDDKIPYIQGVLEPYGEVLYISGSYFTPKIVKDADALIIRTRTICNEQLLAGSSVKFIATATIGYDHIDTDYCEKAGITWTNAPGCNSKSVEQYIASAILVLAKKKVFVLKGKTIGVVGVGQVGSKVSEEEILAKAVLATYDIRKDDADLRRNTEMFENLRGDYPVRREFTSYTINAKNIDGKTLDKLYKLGFKSQV